MSSLLFQFSQPCLSSLLLTNFNLKVILRLFFLLSCRDHKSVISLQHQTLQHPMCSWLETRLSKIELQSKELHLAWHKKPRKLYQIFIELLVPVQHYMRLNFQQKLRDLHSCQGPSQTFRANLQALIRSSILGLKIIHSKMAYYFLHPFQHQED